MRFIGYYLSPVGIDRLGRQAALIASFVDRRGGIRRCRVISSIPVNPSTGVATTNWCLCEIHGEGNSASEAFAALDIDARVERLGLKVDLQSPVSAELSAKLQKFGLGFVNQTGTLQEVLERIGRLLTPTMRVEG